MKRTITLVIILLLCALSLFAQAPEKFNYQAVVRNASNALVTNAPVGVRVSILQGNAAGNAVYVETHTVTTNANGLMTVEIGGGTVQQGSFAGIDWANGPFFLKTETDPAGGANYSITSTQQLMSVPYALYAGEAANGFSGDYNDLTNRPQNVSQLTNDAGYITLNQIPAQVNADWNATEGPAEILNKPTNADYGQGIVRNKVNNPSGETDITVNFSTYQLVNGGVVSLVFTRAVPAGATLNINSMGAKPIYYHEAPLTAGTIKANDRCLFMYNGPGERYYLIAIDRWGVDLDALATVAHTGSYNDLTDKPTIPTVPTNISAFVNDAGYITAIPDSFGGISLESDPIFSAWDKDYNDLINRPNLAPVATSGNYNDLTNKPNLAPVATSGNYNDLTNRPNLAPVATSGNYNDLTNKPTIPTVPTNISAFVNDAGYITAIPDSLGGISLESDPIFSAWDKDYNDLTNLPTNADFGQGVVRNKVNNPSGVTDISVNFSTYELVNGGVVSLAFTRAVPEGATLNINNKGAKPIYYQEAILPAGTIKANDRCLFMYNGPAERYYLIAIDRWGVDLDALATVAHTGSYNDLIDKPNLFSGNYNDLTNKPNIPTVPTNVGAFDNDAGYITLQQVPAQVNADWNATNGAAQILHKPNLAPVATSGNYNDLTNKPTIPTQLGQLDNNVGYITAGDVPAQVNADWNATSGPAKILNKPVNVSAFVNDMGYLTAIPDSLGGISIESDPIFSAWDKDYNDLTNLPTNADFGQGIVRNKVNNASGATDIAVNFSTYELVNGGVVSLAFTRAVPAGATLNINEKGAKPIYYHEAALIDGLIKANDRCLFMYNGPADRYYLIAIDRWGADLDALATVAHTGSYNDLIDKPNLFSGNYNDLTNKPNLAPVATSGNYNDLTNTPTIPTVPTNVGAFDNDAGYITLEQVPAQVNADWNATSGAAQILHKPNLAPVATSGNYNDLTNTPTIPTVPANVGAFDNDAGYITLEQVPAQVNADWNATSGAAKILNKPVNVSAFVNDAGYLTAIPDSLGGISVESDPIFTAWSKDYNDLINLPTNADFGQGIVRNKVNNASGATDIAVNFSTYELVNGGVVSLAFTRAVPAGATLNINEKGAKPIYYHEAALTDGLIKANDRCLFMYNGPADRYYLIAIDRWGADIDALATVAHTGSYNDLTNKPTIPTQLSQLDNNVGYLTASDLPAQTNADWNATSGAAQILHKPNLAPVATSGSYNDLTNKPTIPTQLSQLDNNVGYLTTSDLPAQTNADWDATSGAAQILHRPNLATVATTGDYNDLTNQPTNADFGQGIVRNKVNNPSGETDITVNFSTYELVNGGVVSLAFTRAVPEGATLNINNKGAKPIYYHEAALPAGVIKANDRCLFMYNGPADRYYLLANDRWGADIDALAMVAHTGDYNDLTNTPEIPDITGLQQQLDSLQDVLATAAFTCGTSTVKDYDGNEYNTLKIGSQCWMRENLRTTHFADGTLIPSGTDTSSAVAYRYAPVGNESNVAQYGYLYNWKAAMNGADYSDAIPSGVQGACPDGWHVPSDAESALMVETLSSNSDYSCGGNPYYIAKAMASNVDWLDVSGTCEVCAPCYEMETNNASGFSFMPSGMYFGSLPDDEVPPIFSACISNGYFVLGFMGAIWYSSYNLVDDGPLGMGLMPTESQRLLDDMVIPGEYAISVRCVRDEYEMGYVPTINLHDSLAVVAFTGNYYSLWNRPEIPIVNNATLTIQQNGTNVGTFTANQSTNQTVNITTPTVNNATLTIQQNGTSVGTFTANQSSDQTVNITSLTAEQVQAMINDAVSSLQHKVDSLQDILDSIQDVVSNATYMVPSSGSRTVILDNAVTHVDVYDWGGPDGNYEDSWNGSLTLVTSGSINRVFKITGNYETENYFDTLCIYNGSGVVGANKIVRLSGTGTIQEPIYSSGDTITIQFRSDGSNESVGFALSIDVVSRPSCTAAKAVDVQGHYYSTVQIGNQCWMKENLRTTKYADGADIPTGGNNSSSTEPYYYNYSSSGIPLSERGYLYNWPAAMRGAASSSAVPSGVQGVCPTGWHLPSDAEWNTMEATVSGSDWQTSYETTNNGYRGNHAGKLAGGNSWTSSSFSNSPGDYGNADRNVSGFSAVPAGFYYSTSFYNASTLTRFWSATLNASNPSNAYDRDLHYQCEGVARGSMNKSYGQSVRCLRNN